MDADQAQRYRQISKKTETDGLCYRKAFRSNKIVKYLVLKELKLAAGEMLSWKAVGSRVTGTTAEQQAFIAFLRRKVKDYERHASSRNTLVASKRNKNDQRDVAGSNDSGSREWSSEKPEKKCIRTK